MLLGAERRGIRAVRVSSRVSVNWPTGPRGAPHYAAGARRDLAITGQIARELGDQTVDGHVELHAWVPKDDA